MAAEPRRLARLRIGLGRDRGQAGERLGGLGLGLGVGDQDDPALEFGQLDVPASGMVGQPCVELLTIGVGQLHRAGRVSRGRAA